MSGTVAQMSVVERLRASAAVERIRHERVIAVLRRLEPARLDDVVGAVREAGIGIVEITLDSDEAPAAIARLRQQHPELLVAAGTVRSQADADVAIEAGAQLCVAPGCRAEMVERCLALGVPAVPGALTPTEVEAAWSL
jgi:2-dehydro-3-deoxyphosphogluconate aldolase / (4S)-4-hydroxy-2-oxoglutarate aldolase